MSVPHTGTVFTRYVLGCMGMRDRRETKGEGEYMSHHTDEFEHRHGLNLSGGPIIVPIRDPMLAEMSRINRGWGMPVQHWDHITALPGQPFFFRLREDDLAPLAEFVGRETPADVDWTPKNTWTDFYDYKTRYKRGDVAPELRPAFDWLQNSDPTRALFDSLGYDLPWM